MGRVLWRLEWRVGNQVGNYLHEASTEQENGAGMLSVVALGGAIQQLLLTGWCWGCFPRRALAATCLSQISLPLLNSSENDNLLVTASIVYVLILQLVCEEEVIVTVHSESEC